MKGNAKVIERLNAMLTNELTAINQYFLHARMHKNWGFYRLGERIYHESIGEMKHADWLIERILFLEGLPNLQQLGRLHIGEDGVEALQCDLDLEMIARNDTAAAIALFEPRNRGAHSRGFRRARGLSRDAVGAGEVRRARELFADRYRGASDVGIFFIISSTIASISGAHE
jgi:bacterioferritin